MTNTDIGPSIPAPAWCAPGTEPSYDMLTDGRGRLATWTRNSPDNPSADVWIDCEDRIVDGRVLRSEPRIISILLRLSPPRAA